MLAADAFEHLIAVFDGAGLRRGSMMGRPMLSLNRRMLACLEDDRLGIRLGRDTAEFAWAMTLPDARLFSPGQGARTFRDWVELVDAEPVDWERMLAAALATPAAGE